VTAARPRRFPWARVVVGAVGLAASTKAARAEVVHPVEDRAFRSFNGLPSALLPPSFVLMQAGSYVALLGVSGVLAVTGRHRAGVAAAAAGTLSWLGCKAVKARIGRGRPPAHLEDVATRGPIDTGLGFPSGHSAVAFTMAGVVAPQLPPSLRPLVHGWAVVVGTSRMYVGAHLPLDVVGGASMGLAVGAVGGWLAAPDPVN